MLGLDVVGCVWIVIIGVIGVIFVFCKINFVLLIIVKKYVLGIVNFIWFLFVDEDSVNIIEFEFSCWIYFWDNGNLNYCEVV